MGLHGEVFFPNLTFEKMLVDFGCILNDTEVTRYINITNDSPMPVKYRWSFLEPQSPIVIYPQPLPQGMTGEVMEGSGGEGDQHVAFEEPGEKAGAEIDKEEKGMESEEQQKEVIFLFLGFEKSKHCIIWKFTENSGLFFCGIWVCMI